MTYLPPGTREALSSMGEAELTALLADVRPAQESADPMERAAKALRRSRGLDRTVPATKEQAAEALRAHRPDRTAPPTKEEAVDALRSFLGGSKESDQ